MEIKKGDIITVTVKACINKVGLFVKIEDGRSGLIHRNTFPDFEKDWVRGHKLQARVTRIKPDKNLDLCLYREVDFQIGDIITVRVADLHERFGLFVWTKTGHRALVYRKTFDDFDKVWVPGIELRAIVLGFRSKDKISLALVQDDGIRCKVGDIVSVSVKSYHNKYGLFVNLEDGKEGVVLRETFSHINKDWSERTMLQAKVVYIGLGGVVSLELEGSTTWNNLSQVFRRLVDYFKGLVLKI